MNPQKIGEGENENKKSVCLPGAKIKWKEVGKKKISLLTLLGETIMNKFQVFLLSVFFIAGIFLSAFLIAGIASVA